MNMNYTMIAQIIEFALFIGFCRMFIWPWLLAKIEERQKKIADGLAEAERGRSSLADAQKQTDVLLREARERAHDLIAQAERSAQQRIEEAKAQAKAEADRVIAGAHAQIQQEVQSAKQQLREQVAALAVAGAQRILEREVDSRAHSHMLDQLKAQL